MVYPFVYSIISIQNAKIFFFEAKDPKMYKCTKICCCFFPETIELADIPVKKKQHPFVSIFFPFYIEAMFRLLHVHPIISRKHPVVFIYFESFKKYNLYWRKSRDKNGGKINGRAQFSSGNEDLYKRGTLKEDFEPVRKYRYRLS